MCTLNNDKSAEFGLVFKKVRLETVGNEEQKDDNV